MTGGTKQVQEYMCKHAGSTFQLRQYKWGAHTCKKKEAELTCVPCHKDFVPLFRAILSVTIFQSSATKKAKCGCFRHKAGKGVPRARLWYGRSID